VAGVAGAAGAEEAEEAEEAWEWALAWVWAPSRHRRHRRKQA
jgi:hypothetical protein